jgi:hypothetical protein
MELAGAFMFGLDDLNDPRHTQKTVLTPMEKEILKLHNDMKIKK